MTDFECRTEKLDEGISIIMSLNGVTFNTAFTNECFDSIDKIRGTMMIAVNRLLDEIVLFNKQKESIDIGYDRGF